MSENLIEKLISDSKYQNSFNNSEYISSQCSNQDNDATSSFLNLIDQEILSNQVGIIWFISIMDAYLYFRLNYFFYSFNGFSIKYFCSYFAFYSFVVLIFI